MNPETEQVFTSLIDDVTIDKTTVDTVLRADAVEAKSPVDRLRNHASVVVSEDELWTPEGQAKLARKEAAALRLEEMEPQLREQEEAARAHEESARLESLKAQRTNEIMKFAEEHKDVTTYKAEMMQLIQDQGITFQEAYFRAKAVAHEKELTELRAQLDDQRKTRRSDAMSIALGTSSGLNPQPNKKMTAEERYIMKARQKGIPI